MFFIDDNATRRSPAPVPKTTFWAHGTSEASLSRINFMERRSWALN